MINIKFCWNILQYLFIYFIIGVSICWICKNIAVFIDSGTVDMEFSHVIINFFFQINAYNYFKSAPAPRDLLIVVANVDLMKTEILWKV